ncbi:MAG: glycosyltransferase family 4 protein [Candidatus Omnitrophica bacterium]|nr:glycosyltransferase family 4 protein [Candidatus Omnitrophota bacterium]
MKIVLGVNFPLGCPAGLEVWVEGFLDGLSSVDTENQYLIFDFFVRDYKNRIKKIKIPCANNFHLFVKRVPRPVVTFFENHNFALIEKWLTRQDVDIFHGTSYFIPHLKKIKGIATIHGLDFAEMNTYWYSDKWYRNVGIYLKKADMIIAVSEYVKKSIIQFYGISQEKVKVVYPGIRRNFRLLKEDEYSFPDNFRTFIPFILTVATSVERKNLKRLIESFAIIRVRYKYLKLVIVGDSSLKEKLLPEIEKNRLIEGVHFTGYLDSEQLAYLYNRAELFIFPSLYEGFGLPVLEAMACGCPVVTSNVSALPEVSGGAAILVDPYNVEEIKNAIEKVLTDNQLKKNMRNKGLKHAEKFSWKKSASEIIETYKILKSDL